MINELAIDVRNLLKQAIELAWFSRGSIQYETALAMTPLERDLALEFINKRLELASKQMHPVY